MGAGHHGPPCYCKLTEAEHAAMLEAARRKHPDVMAILAFSDRFCNRPLLVQLPLFPEWVRPACWTQCQKQHGYRIG